MSATTVTEITTDRPGIPFARLVRVELRKMYDTGAGRWLLILTGAMLLLTMGLVLLVLGLNDFRTSAASISEFMVIPVSILIPVFAIVTVTSEWGQRTNLVTFALEPHRGRVFVAKFVAVLGIAVSTILVAIAAGALTNVLYGVITGDEVRWNLSAVDLGWTVLLQLVSFTMAFSLAMLLMSTPLAVTIYYVFSLILPLVVYSSLGFFFDWARTLIPFFDINYAFTQVAFDTNMIGEPISAGGTEWLALVSALLIWIVIPGVIGAARVMRSEVK